MGQKKQQLDKLLKQLPFLTGEEWEEAQYKILQLLPNATTVLSLLEQPPRLTTKPKHSHK